MVTDFLTIAEVQLERDAWSIALVYQPWLVVGLESLRILGFHLPEVYIDRKEKD